MARDLLQGWSSVAAGLLQEGKPELSIKDQLCLLPSSLPLQSTSAEQKTVGLLALALQLFYMGRIECTLRISNGNALTLHCPA